MAKNKMAAGLCRKTKIRIEQTQKRWTVGQTRRDERETHNLNRICILFRLVVVILVSFLLIISVFSNSLV